MYLLHFLSTWLCKLTKFLFIHFYLYLYQVGSVNMGLRPFDIGGCAWGYAGVFLFVLFCFLVDAVGERCSRNNNDFSWQISLPATTVANTINVLLFHKYSAYSNDYVVIQVSLPVLCYLWFMRTALPAAAVTTFPWHRQWQKYIWLQDHSNFPLCPFSSHIRPGHPFSSKKSISLTVLRNFELHLNRCQIYSHHSTNSVGLLTNTKWDSRGGDGKIAFEKWRGFAKKLKKTYWETSGLITVPKDRQGFWWQR